MNQIPPLFGEESSNGNGCEQPFSASDQKIIYRQLFTPVKVSLLGKEYLLQPPSPFMGRVIANFKLSYLDKLMVEANAAKEVSESLKEDAGDVARVTYFQKVFKEMFRLTGFKKSFAMRYVQLILLDAVKPQWKDDYDDFPSDDELEKVIPFKRLDRHASEAEMSTLLEIYEQMQEPALEKNFERWGATEMLMRSSLGRASGESLP